MSPSVTDEVFIMNKTFTALAVGITAAATAITSFAIGTSGNGEKLAADLTLLAKGELISVSFSPDFENNLSDEEQIVFDALEKGVSSYEHRINIAEAGYTEPEELTDFLNHVFNTHPQWGGIDDNITYVVNDGIITEIMPSYDSPETMPTALDSYDPTPNEVAHALADIRDGMTDVEKALIIHDYLVREVDYNLNVVNGKPYFDDVFTLKGVFVDRDAVCQGYALAYSFLLQEVGIESVVVSSEPMNHAWNMIKIDNKWYHVDVTWDDPTNTVEVDFCRGGFISHEFFLRSDAEFKNELDHYGWITQVTQTQAPTASVSDSFNGWSFRPMNEDGSEGNVGMLSYLDGYFYCLSDIWGSNVMVKSKVDGTERTEILLPETFTYMFYFDGYFYASTNNRVCELNAKGEITRSVAISAHVIRNFWLKQDTLAYFEVDTAGNAEKKTVDLVNGAPDLITENGFTFMINDNGEAALVSYSVPDGAVVEELIIPSSVQGYPVTSIGYAVFKDSTLMVRVVVPEGVVSIGNEAFIYSAFTEISFPDSLEFFGDYAVFNCNYLEEITIPKNVTHIGKWAFYACFSLNTVTFCGDVPVEWGDSLFGQIEEQIEIRFAEGREGWTEGTWTDPNGITYKSSSFSTYNKDVNGDGIVNASDAAYLKMALANPAVYAADLSSCDFNGDGQTDADDAVYLLWSLFGK